MDAQVLIPSKLLPLLTLTHRHSPPLKQINRWGQQRSTPGEERRHLSSSWTLQVGQTITGLAAGTYEVTIIDAAGCEVTLTFTINDETTAGLSAIDALQLQAYYSESKCFICSDEALTGSAIRIIDMTGKEVANWYWLEQNSCTNKPVNLSQGFYQVRISRNGFSAVKTLVIH